MVTNRVIVVLVSRKGAKDREDVRKAWIVNNYHNVITILGELTRQNYNRGG